MGGVGCGERERDLGLSLDQVQRSFARICRRMQISWEGVTCQQWGFRPEGCSPLPLFTVVAWRGACLVLFQGEAAAQNSTEVEEVPGSHLVGHASSFEVPGQALCVFLTAVSVPT